MAFIIFLAVSLFLQAAHGGFVCEELPSGMCSFAISSSGKRCSLETSGNPDAGFQCRTSDVAVINSLSHEYIESDECVTACGVDRNAVGISSDSFLEPHFIEKLCTPNCYNNCPNIVDLHFNLALAEGTFLPMVCEAQKTGGFRRQMTQLLSSGIAPSATISAAAAPLSYGAAANGPSSSVTSVVADGPNSSVEP